MSSAKNAGESTDQMNKETKAMIREAGFPEELFFVGSGETFTTNGRYVFKASPDERSLRHAKYAVKYFTALDRYFVWTREQHILSQGRTLKYRTSFSVKRETAEAAIAASKAEKYVEFKNYDRPKEDVLILTEEQFRQFLRKESEKIKSC